MVKVRNLSLGEVEIAEYFFDKHWRKNHIFSRDRKLLNWFYRDSPYRLKYSDGYSIRVGINGCDGTLEGFFAYVPFLFNFHGNREWGCFLSAWWASAKNKSELLGLKMLNELQNQMDFAICISGMNTPIAEKIYKSLGWNYIDNIPRLIYVATQSKMAELLSLNSYEISKQMLNQPAIRFKTEKSSNKIVKTIDSFDNLDEVQWNDLYWKIFSRNYFGPAKELNYLKWRYQDIPIFEYEKVGLFLGEKIIGLLIFRIESIKHQDIKVIRIVDILSSVEDVGTLLKYVIDVACLLNCAFIDFIKTNNSYDEVLRNMGFFSATSPDQKQYIFPYLFQPLSFNTLSLNAAYYINPKMHDKKSYSHKNFSLVKGDYEFDRPT